MKLKSLMLAFFLLIFHTSSSADTMISCDSCDNGKMNYKAYNWGMIHLSTWESETLHIIDASSLDVVSYNVMKIISPNPFLPPGSDSTSVEIREIKTEKTIVNAIGEYREASRALENSITRAKIPIDVIPDPWSFMACASCENDLQDWFNSTAQGEANRKIESALWFSNKLNFSGFTKPTQIRLDFANGGYLYVTVEMIESPPILKMTVNKVVDKNNNTVPKSAVDAAGTSIRMGSDSDSVMINFYLNQHDLFIWGRTGTVIIEDCNEFDDLPHQVDPCP